MSGSTPAGSHRPDVRAELEAERAASAHWRRIADQRSSEYTALRHRNFVRAGLRVERALAPIGPIARAVAHAARAQADRLSLSAASVGRRPGVQLDSLRRGVDRQRSPGGPMRSTLVVVVGDGVPRCIEAAAGAGTEVIAIPRDHRASAEVRRAFEDSDDEIVGIALDTSEPMDRRWLRRLVNEIHVGVVAVTPMLVHPVRPRTEATPHDGRVRSMGYDIRVDADHVPAVRPVGAGSTPDPELTAFEVDSGSAACTLFDRAAVVRAGGFPAGDEVDVDSAVVELCTRMRLGDGGRVVAVPCVPVVDHRAAPTWRSLQEPCDPDGDAWHRALDRAGPLLRRATEGAHGPARFVFTVAAPSTKVAARWGDWHLAEAMSASLQRAGHATRLQTLDRDGPAGRVCDVHVVVRGLAAVRRSAGQGHVLWIISHPESVQDVELDEADLVLVASARFADHLRSRTATPVETLLQATDHRRFRPRPTDPKHAHPVTVVAKTRDVLRPCVADALAAGIRPAIYGDGWNELVDSRLIAADHVPNHQLPIVYSSAGVVLNDHWRTMQAWGFVSNRLFDVVACGTPVVSDAMPEIEALFGDAVRQYRSAEELGSLVAEALADPTAARLRVEVGRAAVLDEHTFDHRARELIDAVERHDLLEGHRRGTDR